MPILLLGSLLFIKIFQGYYLYNFHVLSFCSYSVTPILPCYLTSHLVTVGPVMDKTLLKITAEKKIISIFHLNIAAKTSNKMATGL